MNTNMIQRFTKKEKRKWKMKHQGEMINKERSVWGQFRNNKNLKVENISKIFQRLKFDIFAKFKKYLP